MTEKPAVVHRASDHFEDCPKVTRYWDDRSVCTCDPAKLAEAVKRDARLKSGKGLPPGSGSR